MLANAISKSIQWSIIPIIFDINNHITRRWLCCKLTLTLIFWGVFGISWWIFFFLFYGFLMEPVNILLVRMLSLHFYLLIMAFVLDVDFLEFYYEAGVEKRGGISYQVAVGATFLYFWELLNSTSADSTFSMDKLIDFRTGV